MFTQNHCFIHRKLQPKKSDKKTRTKKCCLKTALGYSLIPFSLINIEQRSRIPLNYV